MTRLTRREYLGLVGVTTAGTLAGCGTARTDGWRQFRASASRTGHDPTVTGPRESARIAWSVRREGQALSGPVVEDGAVYVNGGGAAALGVGDGTTLWDASLAEDTGITPVLDDDRLYVADRNSLVAFDREDGRQRWRFRRGLGVTNAPAIDDDRLYVGFRRVDDPYTATLAALDPATGEERWQAPVGRDGVLLFVPAVDGGLLVLGKEAVYALDPATGERRWRFDDDGTYFGTPALARERVYVGATTSDQAGRVYALDRSDGTVLWRTDLDAAGRAIAVDGTHVYVASDAVYALDAAEGTVRWSYGDRDFLGISPSVGTDRVYLTSLLGEVAALTVEGEERWRLTTDGAFLSSPSLVDETLYTAGQNGFVYALTPED